MKIGRLSSLVEYKHEAGAVVFFICVGKRAASVSDLDCDSFQFLGPGPICSCLLCATLIASGQEADLIVLVLPVILLALEIWCKDNSRINESIIFSINLYSHHIDGREQTVSLNTDLLTYL